MLGEEAVDLARLWLFSSNKVGIVEYGNGHTIEGDKIKSR